jgi:SAM-dependent methyltransferase
VAACRQKFPKQEFAEGDATNLSFIPDGSFDFTIFSFNGIDYIPSNEARLECLREMRRVTRNEGYVVVSSHNARVLGIYPQLEGVGLAKKAWRLARSLFMSPKVAWRTLRSPAYRTGSGFIVDSVHGGLRTHVSTKQCLSAEARAAGLKVIEIVSGYHPRQVPEWLNPWNTFVLQRTDA